jgi:hypothetical protein
VRYLSCKALLWTHSFIHSCFPSWNPSAFADPLRAQKVLHSVKSVSPTFLNVPTSVVPVSGSLQASPSQTTKKVEGPRVSFKSDTGEGAPSEDGVRLSLSSLQRHNENSEKERRVSLTKKRSPSPSEQDELPVILNNAMRRLTERTPNLPVLGGSRRGSAAFSLTEGGNKFLNPGPGNINPSRNSQVRKDENRRTS